MCTCVNTHVLSFIIHKELNLRNDFLLVFDLPVIVGSKKKKGV